MKMIRTDRLIELRINAGYSQEIVAQRTGISRASISLYELGIRQPSLDNLAKLALLYGVTMDYIYGIDDGRIMRDVTVLTGIERKRLDLKIAKKIEQCDEFQLIRKDDEKNN